MSATLFARACARAAEGMEIAAVAAADPARIALWSAQGELSFATLNALANRLARRLRTVGLRAGDAVALACGNRPEFAVVRFAAHRAGLRLTPINWHLAAEDIAWIVADCEAKALFLDATRLAHAAEATAAAPTLALHVAIGGPLPGYAGWEATLDGMDASDIPDPILGNTMLYTSGTTGRPKGVYRHQSDPAAAAQMQQLLTAVFRFDPEGERDRALATGPLYHAGPFGLCLTTPLTAGIGTVLMERWEPEAMLALIERHRITHTFCVPTMFNRLLQLPEPVRTGHDLSSLRFVIHGAAPCSVETKRRMLDWFGPILWELFAGTEGMGTIVGPEEWLTKPGTVGRPAPGQVRILDEAGRERPRGESGRVFLLNPPGSRFEYFRDAAKTAAVQHEGYFTAGDIGYLDEDGYLFLSGRSAEVIISGGVNLYPQEIDDVLAVHPAVADVACVGVPDEDLGEAVKAVVELRPGSAADDSTRASLMAFCAERLAKQKWPRSIDFVTVLPRSEAGKALRAQLRAGYWAGRKRQI
jgi:long-chain acyl-CoA synthetase